MSVAEMKKVINEKVDSLNEDQLKELDIFISKINSVPAKEWNLIDHVNIIVNERQDLLKKLAQ